ncbi:hypothetical protein KO498_16810 [Lentibacter algarum]|uniref:hypothetical protein n=1 Tax=Lentibacter algarum TaxID=576131 RepID=UPI001C0899D7|nr:hypothetical protein [Lentibacter algarum]MBU2983469.1 hypothetical protein [Lentibacter algarum]
MAIVLSSATVANNHPGIFASIVTWLTKVAEAQAQPLRNEIEMLHAKSDNELAALGIKRDQIEVHVVQRRSFV